VHDDSPAQELQLLTRFVGAFVEALLPVVSVRGVSTGLIDGKRWQHRILGGSGFALL
jgi:hypothetical protein